MLKKLIILVVIDLFISMIWIKSLHLDPSVAIYLIFCIPVLFISNAVLGLILKFLKKPWANEILINSIVHPIFFYFLFVNDINSGVDSSYRNFYFQKQNQTFNIMLNVAGGNYYDSAEFEFYKLENNGSSTVGVRGHYFTRKDTILLITDSSKSMKIYNHSLWDYPSKGDKLNLQDHR